MGKDDFYGRLGLIPPGPSLPTTSMRASASSSRAVRKPGLVVSAPCPSCGVWVLWDSLDMKRRRMGSDTYLDIPLIGSGETDWEYYKECPVCKHTISRNQRIS